MKHLFYLFFLIIISVFYISCKNDSTLKRDEAEFTISITEDSLKNEYKGKLSELVDSYRFINLEVTDESLIVEIRKIRFYDNKIFILDIKNKKGVLVFDTTGKYLYTIGRMGNGPAEFADLKSFTINKSTNQVILLDSEGRKLIYYPLDEELISEKRLKDAYSNIEMLGENHMVTTLDWTKSGHKLHLFDTKGNKREEMFTFKPYHFMDTHKPFILYKDTLLYMQKYNDTVYQITPGGVIGVHTIVDYGEHRVTEDKLEKHASRPTWNPKVDCMEGTRHYTETLEHIYFLFEYTTMEPDSPYYVLYNKKNKKSTIYTNAIFNDVSFYPYAPQIRDVNSEDEYISVMEAYILLKSYKEAKADYDKWDEDTRKRYDDMQDFINTLDNDSNPVLMLLKFK